MSFGWLVMLAIGLVAALAALVGVVIGVAEAWGGED